MATLGHNLVGRALKLAQGVWMVHDVLGVNVAHHCVEHEACGDDLPDVLAVGGLVLDGGLRYIAPVSGDGRHVK